MGTLDQSISSPQSLNQAMKVIIHTQMIHDHYYYYIALMMTTLLWKDLKLMVCVWYFIGEIFLFMFNFCLVSFIPQ